MYDKTPFDPHGAWSKEVKKNPHTEFYKDYKPTPSKPVTINDLFPRLERLSIGWSPILEQLKEVTSIRPTYPPYDIVALKEDINLLNVAVAGFSKEELSVTLQDSVLTIEGVHTEAREGDIVYQGIAARDFKLTLAVAEYWQVNGACVKDGMLTVTFQKELPEEKKPKVIDIN